MPINCQQRYRKGQWKGLGQLRLSLATNSHVGHMYDRVVFVWQDSVHAPLQNTNPLQWWYFAERSSSELSCLSVDFGRQTIWLSDMLLVCEEARTVHDAS